MENKSENIKPGYKLTKLGWIPEEWEVVRYDEITIIRVGRDLMKEYFSEEKKEEYCYPVYSNTVDNNGIYGYYNLQEYSGDAVTIVGRGVGLGTAFHKSGGFGAIGRLLVLFPKDGCDSRFLTYYTNYKVRFFVESSGIPQLTGVQLATYNLALPPIKEQQKIARILSTWDKAIETTEQLIQAKTRLKKGLMQQLLTGKSRFPAFAKASVCEKEVEGEGWVERSIKEIGHVISGGTPDTTNEDYWNGNINWCTPTDITALNGRKYLGEIRTKISESGYKNSSATLLPIFSIIICTRATIGDCALNTVPMTTNQGFKSIIPKNVDPEFLYYLMIVNKSRLKKLGAGSTFMEVSKRDFEKIKLTMPQNIDEQIKIRKSISSIDQEIDLSNKQFTHLKMQKIGLMQKLLTGEVRVKTN
ncbi:MAG: restriction endonuclease subunit S [Bacteroidales bacterium]|nr:restriction endonuclease subunit S [Lentimicrobiaceae bacterium]MDD5695195.1 restriction endonuclease subunit S [Bacteroidales bacterium]